MTTESPVRFQIVPHDPAAHLFEVTCTVEDPDPQGQVLSLPAWIPGSYLIRDFAKNIVQLRASSGDHLLAVSKIDKQTWRCAPCSGPLIVHYEVYAWDLSVRSAHLDTTHGYFNGTSVFLRVHGQEQRTQIIDIRPPAGAAYEDWRVATAMSHDEATEWGFGTYRAANYDELIDHPVEMGHFTLATFEAGGIPHHLVITGRHRADIARLRRDLTVVCERHINLFGGAPSLDRYLFLVMVVGEGYGGLEHRASCSLLCSRDDLPHTNQTEVSDKYRGFLGLCSHEYFHTWHVKRTKPAAFTPYDLTTENYTRLLWVFEGFTTYYQNLMLVRGGLINAESFLELLGRIVTRVWRGSGRFKQSLAESSFDSWTKFYKQDENSPNAIVNYYAKGALAALALDMMIRRDTDGKHSLDDVLRALWQRYGQTGEGVPEDGVERLAEEISGLDLQEFFQQVVYGVDDPPLAELLAAFGVQFELRPASSSADQGGQRAKDSIEKLAQRATLGARLAERGADAKLAVVFDGSAAQKAGLAAGDIIVAVDHLRVTRTSLDSMLAAYAPGESVTVHAFRRDELMAFKLILMAPPVDTCVLTVQADCDAAAQARFAAWLEAS